jgi:hypothetical protein
MRLIAHRGNTFGVNRTDENKPDYILAALEQGYDCEIDLWSVDWQFWLGHDEPQYKIKGNFLRDKRLWCHAKNLEALRVMLNMGVHCFWHQEDDYTVTSQGWIWAYPNKPGNARTIAVMPELHNTDTAGFAGVCSDYVSNYD